MPSKLIQIGSGIYNIFKDDLLADKVDFSKTIKVALMDSSHNFSTFNRHWGEVWNGEVKGIGYVAGGQTLQGMTLTRDGGRIMLDADDLLWPSVDVVVRCVVMYFQETEKLICSWDLRCDWKPDGGFFKLEWHKMGLITENNPDDPPQFFTRYLKENV